MITINFPYQTPGVTDFQAQLMLGSSVAVSWSSMTAYTLNSIHAGYTVQFNVADSAADAVQIASTNESFAQDIPLSQSATVDLSGVATLDNQAIIISSIGELSASSGDGAYSVTVTVTDGATALQGASIRLKEGVTPRTATTGLDGKAQFSLDAHVYNLIITKDGYQFTPTTITVDAAHKDFSVAMEQVVLPSPVDPEMSTIYVDCVDGGKAVAGVIVKASLQKNLPFVTTGKQYQVGRDSKTYAASTGTSQVPLGRAMLTTYPAQPYRVICDAIGLNKVVVSPDAGEVANIDDLEESTA